jgi:hypothetical protein
MDGEPDTRSSCCLEPCCLGWFDEQMFSRQLTGIFFQVSGHTYGCHAIRQIWHRTQPWACRNTWYDDLDLRCFQYVVRQRLMESLPFSAGFPINLNCYEYIPETDMIVATRATASYGLYPTDGC